MTLFGWIKKRLKNIPEGRDVYDSVQPVAEGVKAIVQMVIGVSAVIVLVVRLVLIGTRARVALATVHWGPLESLSLFSAVVELAYTLFTDGPDEALDPLILGLSSFALIEISRSEAHLNTVAVPVLLIAVAIFVLFIARRFLLEVRTKDAAETKDVTPPDSYLG
jgi:hypothetical protein